MQTFKQFTFYYVFLHGGCSRTKPNRDELQLCRASQFGDPLQLAIVVAIFSWGSSYTPRILHLEGEEVFGSIKHKQNLPVGLKGDLHKHDCVNFSHMLMEFISRNSTPNADVGQSNHLQEAFLVFTHNGEEVLEHFCGDNIWCIEWCPPKSNVQCSTLQKETKHYYKVKIISKKKNHGIPYPCYVGNWSVTRGVTLKYTSSSFVMMITIIVSRALKGSMQLVGMLCLLYGMCKKGYISLKMSWWY